MDGLEVISPGAHAQQPQLQGRESTRFGSQSDRFESPVVNESTVTTCLIVQCASSLSRSWEQLSLTVEVSYVEFV